VSGTSAAESHGVLIPVKAFRDAKVRLARALAPDDRAALARTMATGVVRAADPSPVWVVCDDPEVAAWATDLGATVLWMPERGLNRAVTEGVATLADEGVRRVVVCHADLPRAHRLDHLGDDDVVVVPDRHRDGTNVIALPTACGFRFAYGPGSFDRHLVEARRLGLGVRIVDDPSLAWDVDHPDDLTDLPHPSTPSPAAPAPRP
jgi:2-phospho-L-lactate/phosphoenolpyruvate guanylyltransferase